MCNAPTFNIQRFRGLLLLGFDDDITLECRSVSVFSSSPPFPSSPRPATAPVSSRNYHRRDGLLPATRGGPGPCRRHRRGRGRGRGRSPPPPGSGSLSSARLASPSPRGHVGFFDIMDNRSLLGRGPHCSSFSSIGPQFEYSSSHSLQRGGPTLLILVIPAIWLLLLSVVVPGPFVVDLNRFPESLMHF